jgi:hypothetical protein
VKAEISRGTGELVITLDADDLPFSATDNSLKARLPGAAGDISEGILSMLGDPPGPGETVRVRVVRVRLVRTEIVAETILELGTERQVYA